MSGILKPIVKEQSKNVVKFETRRKKTPQPGVQQDNSRAKRPAKTEEDEKDDEREKNVKREEHLSLKQAKFDVFKYGIKGFDKKRQEDAKVELAVKLGARVSNMLNSLYIKQVELT